MCVCVCVCGWEGGEGGIRVISSRKTRRSVETGCKSHDCYQKCRKARGSIFHRISSNGCSPWFQRAEPCVIQKQTYLRSIVFSLFLDLTRDSDFYRTSPLALKIISSWPTKYYREYSLTFYFIFTRSVISFIFLQPSSFHKWIDIRKVVIIFSKG